MVSEAQPVDTLAMALWRPGLCWGSVGSSEVRAGDWSPVPLWKPLLARLLCEVLPPVMCILNWMYLGGGGIVRLQARSGQRVSQPDALRVIATLLSGPVVRTAGKERTLNIHDGLQRSLEGLERCYFIGDKAKTLDAFR